MKSTTISWLPLALINLLLPIGILIFAKGFFPYKPVFPGLATYDADTTPPPAPFSKLVFMVVDALRSDFVFSSTSGFTFTQSLISSGAAQPFTAHADSPTITMPRVKAITTGSVPGFLDVILNFAESDTSSSLAQQDTWLAQIKARGDKLIMYGDDTWLKLFPGVFHRHDGTSSFFVSDFTEVDNNVTRHIGHELEQDDWGVMVMHYLGLDHIGHKTGPRGPHMIPKQVEMDEIVREIYTAIEEKPHLQDTLFVLLGDHGMNDAGNHGGSGPGETSPALVLLSPKLKKLAPDGMECPTVPYDGEFDYYSRIQQSDLAPSLAGLLGVPIPKNSLGVFLPGLLDIWNVRERVEVIRTNAKQLLGIVKTTYGSPSNYAVPNHCKDTSSDADELRCLYAKADSHYQSWNSGGDIASQKELTEKFLEFSYRCQDVLSGAASNYDLNLMGIGIAVMVVASIAGSVLLRPWFGSSSLVDLFFPLLTVAYAVMMFASSYVEEEHHFWYWGAAGWFTALFGKEVRNHRSGLGALAVMCALRIVRRWNQTGQKFAGAPDIAKDFFPSHTSTLWILIIVTYIDVCLRVSTLSLQRLGSKAALSFAITVTMACLGFKLSFAAQDTPELIPFWLLHPIETLHDFPLVSQAHAAFGLIFTGVTYTLIFELTSSAPGCRSQNTAVVLNEFGTLFLLTQTRTANIPLFLLFRIIAKGISTLTLSPQELTFTTLLLQQHSFFAFGGANAISSVDLSNAYNGVSGYNVVVVGLLTFISNWIGPIYWASVAPVWVQKKGGSYTAHALAMTVFYAVSAGGVMAACLALRTHLFIWTVFSPKYLYSMAWTVAFQLGINLGWGAAVAWAAGKSVL